MIEPGGLEGGIGAFENGDPRGRFARCLSKQKKKKGNVYAQKLRKRDRLLHKQ